MHKVIITDRGFESLDIETPILEAAGCQIIDARSKVVDELIGLVADADAVITQFAPIEARVIAAMKRARVIVRYGIGVDNVDLEAAAKKRIPVCNVPDYCINEVADHTMGLMLALTRQISSNWDGVRRGEWKLASGIQEMRALRDLAVGVVAFGRIGREVATRLQSFRCRINVFDPMVAAAGILQAGCHPVEWEELLATSDIVTLHCPSTPKTRGMIDAGTLAKMKPGSLLINAARGDLVRTHDLISALKAGHIAGAGLDVTDPEPLPKDSPLLTIKNVIITPHVASTSVKARQTMRTAVANTAVCALRGERPPNVVNGVMSP